MSNIPDLTAGELIQILSATYRAIDLRAILLKDKEEWKVIFFVLRMTIQDKAKLEPLYENKRSLIKGLHSDVQFVYESRAASDIDSILYQIDKGRVLIDKYIAHLENPRPTSEEKMRTASSYATIEDSGFPHKVLLIPYTNTNINPLKHLENHGIAPTDLGLSWLQDINSCFDVGNLYDPYYLILVFPVYARILECYPNQLEKKLFKISNP
jgi:hypothetical protein